MTTKVPEKIIERVRKCLKLANKANGATEAEAAAALAAARKLMDEHNLSMSDVEVKKEVEAGVRSVDSTEKPKAYTPRWEKVMAQVVDYLFNTSHYYRSTYHEGWTGRATIIVFIGVGTDPDVAKESYKILCDIVRRMGSSKGLAGSDLRDYCLGVTETLRSRAWLIKQESDHSQAMSSCRDLVVVKGQLIENFKKDLGLAKGRSWSGRYSQHYDQGRKDGNKVDLNMRKSLK